MITIKVKEIHQEISQLKKLIEEYEKNYAFLYKELSETSFSWKEDRHAKIFFDDLKIEKASEADYLKAIENIYDIFKYIYDKYHQYGDKVYIDLDQRDTILEKFNTCISETNEIISMYNHLDTSFCPYEEQLISSQLFKLKTLRNKYKTTKEKVKDAFDEIIKIEQEVNNKLNNLQVDIIQVFDIGKYLPGA